MNQPLLVRLYLDILCLKKSYSSIKTFRLVCLISTIFIQIEVVH